MLNLSLNLLCQLMWRSVVHDYALFQHDDVPRDKLDIRNDVGRYDNDLIERDLRDVVPDRYPLFRVKSGGRFATEINFPKQRKGNAGQADNQA